MATLEKRVEELEYIIAHLPEDLNARFAGVDVKLAHIREAQALHSTRFSALDARVTELRADVAVLKADMDIVKAGIAQILSRLPPAA